MNYVAPRKYGIAIRVQIKDEVWHAMSRNSQKMAIKLAAGQRFQVYSRQLRNCRRCPEVLVVYQNNLNEFMDFMHGGR